MGFPPHALADRLERLSIPEPNSGCMLWLGSLTRGTFGYGSLVIRPETNIRKFKSAHVVAYELAHGPVPKGLVIDHKCNTTICINPDHLHVVTQRENLLKSEKTFQGINSRKTHCVNGHEFTTENTYVTKKGHRQCRACWKARHAAKS